MIQDLAGTQRVKAFLPWIADRQAGGEKVNDTLIT